MREPTLPQQNRHPRARLRRAVLAVLAVFAVAIWGPSPTAEGGTCGPAGSDPGFYQQMVSGRTDGWLGADTTGHIDLGGDRILWLFGDSHWGNRRGDGGYADGWRFVTNSVTAQDGGCTVAHRPFRNFVDPSAGADLYWPNDGWVAGDDLYIVFSRIQITGGSLFSFRSAGRDLVRFDRHDLSVQSRQRLPSAGGRDWGSSVERVGNTIYWWGRSFDTDTGVHRLARSSVLAPTRFEYRTAQGWSTDAGAAVPVHRRQQTSNATFHQLPDGRWAAVYKDHELFGTGIVADVADNPWGPFAHMGRIANAAPRSAGGGEITYAATIHPGLGWDEGRLLVTWSHNALDGARVIDGRVRYQPSFTTVSTDVLSNPAGYAELDRVRDFVVGAHRTFLGRKPAGALADYWANEINAGVSRLALTDRLARSEEWIGSRIDALHRQAIDRPADPATTLRWTEAIAGGERFGELAAHVYGSDEFYLRAGADDRRFVTSLYRRILRREPSRADVDGWTDRLAGGASRADVVRAFWASAESRTVRADDLYQRLLRRPGDPAGLAAAMRSLASGDDLGLAAALATSEEYVARVQRTN